jgi:hypothetical protein
MGPGGQMKRPRRDDGPGQEGKRQDMGAISYSFFPLHNQFFLGFGGRLKRILFSPLCSDLQLVGFVFPTPKLSDTLWLQLGITLTSRWQRDASLNTTSSSSQSITIHPL